MAAKQPLRTGQSLQNYKLLEELGQGGEAVVWSGWDQTRQRAVAIKLIPTAGSQPALISSGFDRQVHLIASLTHPNILPLYEFGTTSDYYFFVMRYASGGALSDLLKRQTLTNERVLCLTADIIAALEYLHSNRIVHRDLKPSNILLDSQGRAYLTDFGLARRLTEDTVPLHTGRGTTFYASPEQHSRSQLSPRSDIYSLGVVLYEMLTGSLPEADSAGEIHFDDSRTTVKLPRFLNDPTGVRDQLLGKLHRLAAYNPKERPDTIRQASDLLFEGLPEDVTACVREARRDLPATINEDDLLRADTRTLLRQRMVSWVPQLSYPASLTEVAYIDAAYAQPQHKPAGVPPTWVEFELEGALRHGHHESRWWRRVPDASTRLRVCERILATGTDEAVARVLTQMVDAQGGSLPYRELSGEAVERLINLAVHSSVSLVRSHALTLLDKFYTPADRWRPVAFSEAGDVSLAELAMREGEYARQAAELIGRVRSETAFRVLLEGYQADPGRGRRLVALQEVRAAGGLPPWTPLGVRARSIYEQVREQFVEDQAVLSWSRALMGLLGAAIISALMITGLFERANVQTHDVLYQPYPVSGIVTIVEINDETLSRYGRWSSWPRTLHADLINALDEAGADVIVLDFTFVSATAEDDTLAEAMTQAGNVVQPVLAQGDAFSTAAGGPLEFYGMLQPQPEVMEASAAVGHTNFRHDPDGYVRRLPLVVLLDNDYYPNLGLAAIQVYLGETANPASAVENADGQTLHFAGREIPVNRWDEMLIHYAGPPAQTGQQSFRMVSYEDVLDGTAPPEAFEDKIVLVGITATAEPDRYLTPVSENGRPMYGVEILANAVETIWSGRFIRQPSTAVRILVMLALGVIVGLACTRPWLGLLTSGLIAAVYIVLASWLFDFQGIMLDLFFPLLTIVLSYGIVTAYRFSIEARERRQILNLFEKRVAPHVAREALVAVRQGRVNLGGQAQEVSVLAVSLRGYAEYVAQNPPEDVLTMLDTYLDVFSEALFEYEGTLIQIAGENVVAIFNAPLAQADHGLRAMQVAVESRRRIEMYHRSLPADHPHKLIDFSYGAATGRAVVGYAGPSGRHNYMALGEAVDRAVRLMKAAAPGEVLVSGSTYQAADGHVNAELLSPASGRQLIESTNVYLVKSIRDKPQPSD